MTDIKHFKDMLEKEALTLENELKSLGKKSDTNPDDWDAVKTEDTDRAEDGEVAQDIEDYENNNAELGQLEVQLKAVKEALMKISKGNYGTCEVCGKVIEEDRLAVNPSARTCKLHM
jgi:DnaK suppressor protein